MGHAMTLALHFSNFLKSSRRFEELMAETNGHLQSINCFQPIQAEFEVEFFYIKYVLHIITSW